MLLMLDWELVGCEQIEFTSISINIGISSCVCGLVMKFVVKQNEDVTAINKRRYDEAQ